MFRYLSNRTLGRKKSLSERINLEETLQILGTLQQKGLIKIRLSYQGNDEDKRISDTSTDIAEFIKRKFNELPNDYTRIDYVAYSGKKDEKHYFEFEQGISKKGKEDILRMATIEILAKR